MEEDSGDPVLRLGGEASLSSVYRLVFPGAHIPIQEGVLPARHLERFSLDFGPFPLDPFYFYLSVSV